MILSDEDIIKYIKKYNLIENFSIDCIQPASYDVRISNKIVKYKDEVLRKNVDYEVELYEYDKAILLPRKFIKSGDIDEELEYFKKMFPEHLVIRCPVLSSTIEKINLPSELCAFYTGRSSWGRKFVESHKTAGYCDPGWSGTVTLEISVDMPVEIHATERIGQLVFMKTNKPKIDYSRKPDAKYQNQELPTPSKTIVDDTINIIYVDGTVNKNPGKFGIAGVLYDNKYYCYTYEMKVTNNIMEALAIYHALDFIKSEKKNIIFSDSLLTVKAIRGEINVVKNPYAKIINKIKERLEDLDVDVEIRHRKGHTCHDFIGNKISSIMKQYNKTNKLISGNDTKIIRGDIKCIL